jgi:hypothetical protein
MGFREKVATSRAKGNTVLKPHIQSLERIR